MLTPDQVVPFLLHDDVLVRRHVVRYLRDASDVGPLTVDHCWAAIDRFGADDDVWGIPSLMAGLPAGDGAVGRLLRAVAPGAASARAARHYQDALQELPFDALVRNRDAVLTATTLPPAVREHLDRRLSLADHPPGELFDQLMDYGRDLGDSYSSGEIYSRSAVLVEAIARRADPAVLDQAMATLDDESATHDWREIFAVQLLGHARHGPAVGRLVDRFEIDADVLREEASKALARIGTADVADRLAAFYPGKPWHVRLYTAGPLGHLKRPESEAALLKMLAVEQHLRDHPAEWADDEGGPLLDHVLNELVDLGSLAGHAATLELVAVDPEHPEVVGICEGLVASAVMAGVTLPKEAVWRRRIDRYHTRVTSRVMADLDAPPRPSPGPKSAAPAAFAGLGDDRLAPLRRDAPKVGRNDPCPCGSGKKHKKCCGAPK